MFRISSPIHIYEIPENKQKLDFEIFVKWELGKMQMIYQIVQKKNIYLLVPIPWSTKIFILPLIENYKNGRIILGNWKLQNLKINYPKNHEQGIKMFRISWPT